jgi:hypothetical protein
MNRRLMNGAKAATHFASLREESGLASSMFIQDIPLGIMPMRSSQMKGYCAKLVGETEDNEKALALLQSFQEYERHDLNEIVASAIHEISQDMAWYGRSAFEIIASDEDLQVRLQQFTPASLFRVGLVYLQIIPRGDRDFWGRSMSILPTRDVWVISMPSKLGGVSGYRKILRMLRRGDRMAPRFWQADLERGIVSRVFDFSEYRRETEICEARATRGWGWTRRDFSGRNWTEFALFHRLMTFRWAQAILREHIVSELNALFPRLSIKSKLEIFGLPSSADVSRLRNDMTEGRISYAKASDACSIT